MHGGKFDSFNKEGRLESRPGEKGRPVSIRLSLVPGVPSDEPTEAGKGTATGFSHYFSPTNSRLQRLTSKQTFDVLGRRLERALFIGK